MEEYEEHQLTDGGVIVEVSQAPAVLKSGFLESFVVVKRPLYIYGIAEQNDENERLLLVSYHSTREQALMPPESVNVVDSKILQCLGERIDEHIRVYHAIWMEFGALSRMAQMKEGELCNIGHSMKAHQMPPEECVRDVPFFVLFGKYRRPNTFAENELLLWELDIVGQPTYDNLIEEDEENDGLGETRAVPLAMRNYGPGASNHRGLKRLADDTVENNPHQHVAGGVWDIAHILQNETTAVLPAPWVSFYFKNIQQSELRHARGGRSRKIVASQSKPKKKKVVVKRQPPAQELSSSDADDDDEDYHSARVATNTSNTRQSANRSNPRRSARGQRGANNK